MGQSNSSVISLLNSSDTGENIEPGTQRQVETILRELVDFSNQTEALIAFENTTKRKYKTTQEKCACLSLAIHVLEIWGRYRLVPTFAVRKIELGHQISINGNDGRRLLKSLDKGSSIIIADSYLSLARANYFISNYQKSIDYAQQCLDCVTGRQGGTIESFSISGYSYLFKGKSFLALGDLRQAMKNLEKSLSIANFQDNKRLECLSCCAMGALYLEVRDYEKAIFFPTKATEILSEYGKDWEKKYRITSEMSLASAYRKVGKLDEAMRTSEDVMQIALEENNRMAQARCMLCFADVHRVRKDPDRALPRYAAALGLMLETGDRFGQVLVAIGKAKAFVRKTDFRQALHQYSNGMQLSECIGSKMASMRIHGELAVLYQRISDQDRAKSNTLSYHRLIEALALFCGVCKEPIGEKHEQLETLPCSHIFHLKCATERGILDTLSCPNCIKPSAKVSTL